MPKQPDECRRKHSHPELPALGRAEDLSHCSTDCLQIFMYIYLQANTQTWGVCTRTNHKQWKSRQRMIHSRGRGHVWKVATQWKNLESVELRRRIAQGKLFEETESASAICNVMSLICILKKKCSPKQMWEEESKRGEDLQSETSVILPSVGPWSKGRKTFLHGENMITDISIYFLAIYFV